MANGGAGQVRHPLNPRLHADDLIHVINDAADQVLFFDKGLADRVTAKRKS